ncbi:MAG: outer membrane beta-barrel protein [Bacteroidetes bacterium]|nr:outer membrane beta-barrel protein [Bacteroidota bacterium]
MSKGDLNIDNILKDRLSSFEGKIPLSDWNIIEKKLNRRKRIFIFYWSSITLLLLIGSFVLYNSATKNYKEYNLKTENLRTFKKPIEKNTLNKEIENKIVLKYPKTEKNNKNSNLNSIATETYNSNEQKSNIGIEYIQLDLISKFVSDLYNFNMSSIEKSKILNLNKPIYNSNKSNCKFSIEIGVNFSPSIGMEAIKENAKMNKFINHSYFNAIAGSSSFGNGMNNGLNMQINYNKKWFISSGINFKEYSVYHSFDYTISEFPNVDILQGILKYLPKSPENVKYEGKGLLKFINIPLLFGYRHYFTPSLGIESKTGINLSKFSTGQGKSVNPTYLHLEDYSRENIRNWSKGYTLSTGIFYKSKRNFIFTLEPNYSSMIGSAYKKSYPVKNRLYNYGLNFNINYIIK